jgi:hypothetical protein
LELFTDKLLAIVADEEKIYSTLEAMGAWGPIAYVFILDYAAKIDRK